MKNKLLLVFFFTFLFISCKKDEINKPLDIYKKWLLVEYYDGYVNGGTFTWSPVSTEASHYLELAANGSYIKHENANKAFQKCTGTFQLLPDNRLEINTNCNASAEIGKISDLTDENLIIDFQVREGTIRYKYRVFK
jgi:hypothetical protein